jgi:succinate dehydrogenase / fumarate reductase iron-sulfur subunit
MENSKWKVRFQIYRQKGPEKPHYDQFELEVDPDEYVLDGVERVWAFHDRSLAFRHACHHSTCGACGMRVNGVEKLTCITPVREVTQDGGLVRVEPLRNFPVVSDLVVDMGRFYTRLEAVGHRTVLPIEEAEIELDPTTEQFLKLEGEQKFLRLADCIECGLCISACPIATTTPAYLGPAVLAGAHQHGLKKNPDLLKLVDSEDGVWRCHSAFECTHVCPSNVEPAWRIMELRKGVVRERLRKLFSPAAKKPAINEVTK